jgi:hypothetical protein
MERETIRKWKWIWGWEDDKEETWLHEMSLNGLHLRSVDAPGLYRFEKGQPKNYYYRLDFKSTPVNDFDEYCQLFVDAGWDHVEQYFGWQYFRKEAHPGEIPEIFSDNASKIEKYKRLLGFLLIINPILLIGFTIYLDEPKTTLIGILEWIYIIFLGIALLAIIKIYQRIQSLRKV